MAVDRCPEGTMLHPLSPGRPIEAQGAAEVRHQILQQKTGIFIMKNPVRTTATKQDASQAAGKTAKAPLNHTTTAQQSAADRPVRRALRTVACAAKCVRVESPKPVRPAPKPAVAAVPPGAKAGRLSPEKQKFYDALIALRNQIMGQVRNLSATTLTSNKQAGEELADIGSDNFSREIGLAMMTEDGKKLSLIQEALERFANGSFGQCTDCGGKIGDARLRALPHARLCIDCQSTQEAQEQLNAAGGDAGLFEEKETGESETERESEDEDDSDDESEEAETP